MRKPTTHKRMKKKRTAIPVQPPKVPFGTYVSPPEIPLMYQRRPGDKKHQGHDVHEEESSIDVSSPRDNNSPIFGVVPKLVKENDREKLIDAKRDVKEEKRRTKEESIKQRKLLEKEKELEKKKNRKSKQQTKSGGLNEKEYISLPEFVKSEKNFLEKCIEFIELEGLDSEGIYRVPGNRAHVDLLYKAFEEGEIFFSGSRVLNIFLFFVSFLDPNSDIEQLDIPVNAVATALKDFFSKHLPPIFEPDLMTELEDIAGKSFFYF